MTPDRVLRWVVRETVGLDAGPLPNGAEWSAALQPLSANRLPALAGWLLGPRLSEMPNPVRQVLSGAGAKSVFAIERCGSQLRELTTALEQRDHAWVILKGLPLAERLYPDPVCRPSRDVDLMVEPQSLEPIGSLLGHLGYHVESTPHDIHHRRYLRPAAAGWDDIVELHWRTDPDSQPSLSTGEMLGTRRLVDTRWGPVWIPGPEAELDHLVRHYIRHAGWQLILLLDILLALRDSAPATHRLGAALADDQRRLGLEPRISGPSRLRDIPLRRWLAHHDFSERRTARRTAPIAVALAQGYSVRTWLSLARGLVWPAVPSFRWQTMSSTPWGRRTWRWYRLLTLGKGAPS